MPITDIRAAIPAYRTRRPATTRALARLALGGYGTAAGTGRSRHRGRDRAATTWAGQRGRGTRAPLRAAWPRRGVALADAAEWPGPHRPEPHTFGWCWDGIACGARKP